MFLQFEPFSKACVFRSIFFPCCSYINMIRKSTLTASDGQFITSPTSFFVSRLLQLSEECVLKTSLVHSSCLMSSIQAFKKLLHNRNNQHQHISPDPCSFSLPCVTWLPAADFHTLNIRAVLSGILNQVFSKPSLKVHSDTFPISNMFQVSASWFSYCTDKNWIR